MASLKPVVLPSNAETISASHSAVVVVLDSGIMYAWGASVDLGSIADIQNPSIIGPSKCTNGRLVQSSNAPSLASSAPTPFHTTVTTAMPTLTKTSTNPTTTTTVGVTSVPTKHPSFLPMTNTLSPQSSPNATTKNENNNNAGLIAGVTIGVFFAVVILIGVCLVIFGAATWFRSSIILFCGLNSTESLLAKSAISNNGIKKQIALAHPLLDDNLRSLKRTRFLVFFVSSTWF